MTSPIWLTLEGPLCQSSHLHRPASGVVATDYDPIDAVRRQLVVGREGCTREPRELIQTRVAVVHDALWVGERRLHTLADRPAASLDGIVCVGSHGRLACNLTSVMPSSSSVDSRCLSVDHKQLDGRKLTRRLEPLAPVPVPLRSVRPASSRQCI